MLWCGAFSYPTQRVFTPYVENLLEWGCSRSRSLTPTSPWDRSRRQGQCQQRAPAELRSERPSSVQLPTNASGRKRTTCAKNLPWGFRFIFLTKTSFLSAIGRCVGRRDHSYRLARPRCRRSVYDGTAVASGALLTCPLVTPPSGNRQVPPPRLGTLRNSVPKTGLGLGVRGENQHPG